MIEGSCHCGTVRWSFDGPLESANACNCTVCRRYGVLWAYGHEGEEIEVAGPTKVYTRGRGNIGFHFCQNCGCVTSWRATSTGEDSRRRIAVNLRLADDPDQIASLPIDHFDGLASFRDLPRDGKCEGHVVLSGVTLFASDAKAAAGVAASDDVPGFATGADTLDALIDKLTGCHPRAARSQWPASGRWSSRPLLTATPPPESGRLNIPWPSHS